jgi:hypothetical protein
MSHDDIQMAYISSNMLAKTVHRSNSMFYKIIPDIATSDEIPRSSPDSRKISVNSISEECFEVKDILSLII